MRDRNGSLKLGPQLPPTMPRGFYPFARFPGLGRGTNVIRVIVSHGYRFLARALHASRPHNSDHTKAAADNESLV
jgi:hypothetical protein